jgi:hypothetical protein
LVNTKSRRFLGGPPCGWAATAAWAQASRLPVHDLKASEFCRLQAMFDLDVER